ncbi:MAG TPA: cytochrome D1 domain-containing protein [Beijerinckiaceae bacterium]|nr:cytochrome D1 domain-containing protein [Beijerinckiaceae bacterium]
MKRLSELLLALVCLPLLATSAAAADAEQLYQTHCVACHGTGRLGAIGPALLPENMGRLRGPAITKVIAEGREATQMPGFGQTLAKDEIEALTAYISRPLPQMPAWGPMEISASRSIERAAPALAKPVFSADPLNLFVVVEIGDHHATILDGDKLEPLTRFPTRFALHGGPKFSPDGRFVYFMSRDGWVEKYDIWSLQKIGEVRAGINARNIALSTDGKTIAVANYLPNSLVLLNAEDLSLIRIFDAVDTAGKSSRVSAVYQARPRDSFVVALKDVAEIWEIPTKSGDFPLRRIKTGEPLDDFFFDPSYAHVFGSAREGAASRVYNLDRGVQVAEMALPGLPHLGSGITFKHDGRPLMATPHLRSGLVSIIAMDEWKTVKTVTTPGPGFFMRSHENSPFAWTDSMMSKAKDTMSILDKRSLEIVRSITPSPGKTAAHVEFDRYGKQVLVSIWEDPGELIIYDAQSFAEIKRMPMRKPSGKYNVYNKITFSEGTSH